MRSARAAGELQVCFFRVLTFRQGCGFGRAAGRPAGRRSDKDTGDVSILVARLFVTFLVIFSYPLQSHPARICLDNIYRVRTRRSAQMTATRRSQLTLSARSGRPPGGGGSSMAD